MDYLCGEADEVSSTRSVRGADLNDERLACMAVLVVLLCCSTGLGHAEALLLCLGGHGSMAVGRRSSTAVLCCAYTAADCQHVA